MAGTRPRIKPVLFTVGADLALDTNRGTLLTPTTGKALEILRVKAMQETTDGLHLIELYMGTGTNLAAAPSKGIDILRVADLSEDSSQTRPLGRGIFGARDEVLSARHRSVPATIHIFLIWYRELDQALAGEDITSSGDTWQLPN